MLDARDFPRIDQNKVRKEARLEGKYLLRTSDDTLSPEDVALGYKQLLEVEDAFRTLKSTLDLRPMYHRVSDRIRAHVLLCWLALLLVRVAETQVGDTWPRIRTQILFCDSNGHRPGLFELAKSNVTIGDGAYGLHDAQRAVLLELQQWRAFG